MLVLLLLIDVSAASVVVVAAAAADVVMLLLRLLLFLLPRFSAPAAETAAFSLLPRKCAFVIAVAFAAAPTTVIVSATVPANSDFS